LEIKSGILEEFAAQLLKDFFQMQRNKKSNGEE